MRSTCSSDTQEDLWHSHIALVNGRAKLTLWHMAKHYWATIRGPREEEGVKQQSEISNLEVGRSSPHTLKIAAQTQEVHNELENYWYDTRRGWLPPAGVRKARMEEVEDYRKYGVTEIRPNKEYKMSRKRVVDTKWFDKDKRSPGEQELKSRLVARETKSRQ